ncbi:MAG: major outer membrane protein [Arcobacter sp.]|uniref:major outer membrane protein n=1 Tax=Arcobacter sp. TaxID=1872629 RepID=UPI003D03A34A
MKKIAKLSLVAAVAVAGLTSANAQPLEEAIKNVDVSGSVVYRYNDYKNDGDTLNGVAETSDTDNNYKVALNLSSKVNEDVKFNSRFLVADADGAFAATKLDTQNADDANPGVSLSHAYFGYTGITNTTVNVGKQGLTTPWTTAIDSDGNEQTGTGALALSTVGPVTLAAAYFNQTNLNLGDSYIGNKSNTTTRTKVSSLIDGSDDIVTVGAIAAVGPVTMDAWYLDLTDIFDTYTIGAKASFDVSGIKLGADARYVSLNLDDSIATTDNNMAKIVLTADAGLVDAKLAYAMTDKEGGLTALDNDATATLLGWNLTSNGKADADYWQAVLGFDILSNLNLSANYGNLQYVTGTTDVEEEEVYAQLLYKMSKNLNTYVRYGTYTNEETTAGNTVDRNDDTRGRLQVEYTF